MMKIVIDDRRLEVREGMTVLEVARQAGIFIPTLCFLKVLGPNRACRLCVVEAEGPSFGRTVLASCNLQVSEGLVIWTASPLILTVRAGILELLLASLPGNESVQEIAEKLGVSSTRLTAGHSDKCILCGICIKACREKIGISALSFATRGDNTRKVAEFVQLDGSRCIGCGTCANLCPIRAIQVEDKGDSRLMSLYGEVVHSLELAACSTCGTFFTSRRVIDYLDSRLENEVPAVQRVNCPNCARAQYAAERLGMSPLTTGEQV